MVPFTYPYIQYCHLRNTALSVSETQAARATNTTLHFIHDTLVTKARKTVNTQANVDGRLCWMTLSAIVIDGRQCRPTLLVFAFAPLVIVCMKLYHLLLNSLVIRPLCVSVLMPVHYPQCIVTCLSNVTVVMLISCGMHVLCAFNKWIDYILREL